MTVWQLGREKSRRDFSVACGIRSLALHPDGRVLATVGEEREVRLWDAETGMQIGLPLTGSKDTLVCVAFSRDGELLAAGGFDNIVRVWKWKTDTKPWQELTGASTSIFAVLFSDDDRTLYSGDGAGVRLWDVETWQQRFRFRTTFWVYHLAHVKRRTDIGGSRYDRTSRHISFRRQAGSRSRKMVTCNRTHPEVFNHRRGGREESLPVFAICQI